MDMREAETAANRVTSRPDTQPEAMARALRACGEMFHESPRSWRNRVVCSPVKSPAMMLRTQMGVQGGCGMSLGHNFGYSPEASDSARWISIWDLRSR